MSTHPVAGALTAPESGMIVLPCRVVEKASQSGRDRRPAYLLHQRSCSRDHRGIVSLSHQLSVLSTFLSARTLLGTSDHLDRRPPRRFRSFFDPGQVDHNDLRRPAGHRGPASSAHGYDLPAHPHLRHSDRKGFRRPNLRCGTLASRPPPDDPLLLHDVPRGRDGAGRDLEPDASTMFREVSTRIRQLMHSGVQPCHLQVAWRHVRLSWFRPAVFKLPDRYPPSRPPPAPHGQAANRCS